MSSLPIVLVFTYPEHGQANVNLATSYELALAGVDVYIASSISLKARISRLQELIDRQTSNRNATVGSVAFHEIDGFTPYMETIKKRGINEATIMHSHGVSGALESFSKLEVTYFPWSQEEYLTTLEGCKEVIRAIKPTLAVVDTAFHTATDACKFMDQKFMITLPTGLKDAVLSAQPYLAALWKYPIVSSGFPFPLKWWQVPLNIYLYIRLVSRMTALHRTVGLHDMAGVDRFPGVTCVCPSLTKIDFPFTVIPEELLLCGPIIIPFHPLEESDPELLKWLDNGPTVLVNLGSQVVIDETIAREMASAFRILLDHHNKQVGSRKIQVLWKARTDGDIQEAIDEIIGKEIEEGRIKVVPWLDVEPVSILQHQSMICTVHHGGANSFYEGVWSGIPQVVLPVWYDTYDYARLAELLNIGIFGSTTSAPGVRAEEFGKALMRVTGDSEEAIKFRTSAMQLKEVCREKGVGRKLASVAILKEINMRRFT